MNNYLDKKIQKLSTDKDEIQLKMDLYSTMIPFLLSTDNFSRNNEIKDFTNRLKLKEEMKDYLFASRTQVAGRIVREIEDFNEIQLKENIQIFKAYNNSKINNISEQSNRNVSRKNKNKAEEKILKMMDKYSRNKDSIDE
ncbi:MULTISPECIES: hypothetical protein [Exiguobacterium]|uniref:hypothetical protein n=1 Tax=Exiguobacterium TaxID=33986 RepID=UPI000479782C|nr:MULTISPECIES: hypothetical protein [Exiguobacterium]